MLFRDPTSERPLFTVRWPVYPRGRSGSRTGHVLSGNGQRRRGARATANRHAVEAMLRREEGR